MLGDFGQVYNEIVVNKLAFLTINQQQQLIIYCLLRVCVVAACDKSGSLLECDYL